MDLQRSKILDFLYSNFSMDLGTKLIFYYPQWMYLDLLLVWKSPKEFSWNLMLGMKP